MGLARVEVEGVPPGKDQAQDVGEFVEVFVYVTVCPAHTDVAVDVKLATGDDGAATPVILILSIYN